MKKGKWFALKSINGLLGSLLAVMGFSACEEVADMYGAVHTDYTIKGTVTNEADEPLPGIRIRSPWTVDYNDTIYTVNEDTVYTDANGKFTYTYMLPGASMREEGTPLLIEDIDGEANGGSYASDSVSVSFKDTELTGGDEWFLGRAEKEITIQLRQKEGE